MTLTPAAALKPLSAVQRKVICAQARRFGLLQPGADKLEPGGLDEIVREGNPIHVAVPHCQPFQLGLMPDGQAGIKVDPDIAFAQLPTKQLSEEEIVKLIEDGIVLHTFDPHQRQLAFTFSYKFGEGRDAIADLAVDAIDFQRESTIGTAGVSIELAKGLVEDKQIIRPPLSEAAQRFLSMNKYDPGWVYVRRKELTDEGFSLFGSAYVNMKVEPGYRNRGTEGFYGIAQILMTTVLRLAAEQFFSISYLLQTQEKLCPYFERTLGARRSVKFPIYAFRHIMICSFSGSPGVELVESILDQRNHKALCDFD